MVKEWLESISEKKFKNYTHFDTNKPIKDSQEDLSAFESFLNPKNIIKRNFWPLIRYEIKEKKFIRFEDEIPEYLTSNVSYKIMKIIFSKYEFD